MSKYDEEFKRRVVEDYLAGSSGGLKAVAKKHGVGKTTLEQWVEAYRQHGQDALVAPTRKARYTAEFKLSVLQRMGDEELSCQETRALFNLRGTHTVRDWERRYREGGLEALHPKPAPGRPRKMPTPPPSQPEFDDSRSREELLRENRRLRAEVDVLKKLDALVRARKQTEGKNPSRSSD